MPDDIFGQSSEQVPLKGNGVADKHKHGDKEESAHEVGQLKVDINDDDDPKDKVKEVDCGSKLVSVPSSAPVAAQQYTVISIFRFATVRRYALVFFFVW